MTETLEIGKIFGGMTAANVQWEDDLRWLTKSVRRATAGLDIGLNINMQFQVPGPLLRPDFEGARWGRFSSKEGLLVVQVEIPERPPADPRGFLIDRVLLGLDEVAAWAAKRKRRVDLQLLSARVRGIPTIQ